MKTNIITKLVTEQIIKELEKGNVVWQKDWKTFSMPMNYINKKPYNGLNLLILSLNTFSSPYYLTFNQVRQLKGQVKKGETGTRIIFWKLLEDEEEDKMIPLLRYYTVFNIEQTTLEVPVLEGVEINPIEEAEAIINNYKTKPTVEFKGDRAYYQPKEDRLVMPNKNLYNSTEGYYSTYFHELVHSTGHASRLKRFDEKQTIHFGNEIYTKEELIAELGNAFLCAKAKISNKTLKNSAGYLNAWLKVIKADPSLLIKSSSKANQAFRYILGEGKLPVDNYKAIN